MRLIYVVWGILPAVFYWLAFWGLAKRAAKIHGREYSKDYLTQAYFCSFALALAIAIDKVIFPVFVSNMALGGSEEMVARWILYPFSLLILAYLQKLINARKHQDSKVKRTGF